MVEIASPAVPVLVPSQHSSLDPGPKKASLRNLIQLQRIVDLQAREERCFRLTYIEGDSLQNIAKIIDENVTQVRMCLMSSQNKIKNKIEDVQKDEELSTWLSSLFPDLGIIIRTEPQSGIEQIRNTSTSVPPDSSVGVSSIGGTNDRFSQHVHLLQKVLGLSSLISQCLYLAYDEGRSLEQIANTLSITKRDIEILIDNGLEVIKSASEDLEQHHKKLYNWVIKNILKPEKKKRSGNAPASCSIIPEISLSVDNTIDQKNIDILSKAVKLTLPRKKVLSLLVQGHSTGKIATILDSTESSVSQLIFHSRRKIKVYLEDNLLLDSEFHTWIEEKILARRKRGKKDLKKPAAVMPRIELKEALDATTNPTLKIIFTQLARLNLKNVDLENTLITHARNTLIDSRIEGRLIDKTFDIKKHINDVCTQHDIPFGVFIDIVLKNPALLFCPTNTVTNYSDFRILVHNYRSPHSNATNSSPVSLRSKEASEIHTFEAGGEEYVYINEQMHTAVLLAKRLASEKMPVLILGETGVGKEGIARLLHESSDRARFPFSAINCSAIPADLLESELFGHKRGSFTGATSNRKGLFETVERGTLFLDEIGEMDPRVQSKLLRVLQEKEFRPVGSNEDTKFRGRVIAATNRDLTQEIQSHTFRSDLLYRIAQSHIIIPKLKDRIEDIDPLLRIFLKQLHPQLHIKDAARNKLKDHSFPGNIRELQAILRQAYVLATLHSPKNLVIDAEHIRFFFAESLGEIS